MNAHDLRSLIGQRIRVFDGVDGKTMFGEGEVIGLCEMPTIVIRADDGTIHHHASTLPIEVQRWERLP